LSRTVRNIVTDATPGLTISSAQQLPILPGFATISLSLELRGSHRSRPYRQIASAGFFDAAQRRRAVNVPVQRPRYVPLPALAVRVPEKVLATPGTHIAPVGVIDPFPPGPLTIPFAIVTVNTLFLAVHLSEVDRVKIHTPS